MSKTLDEKMLGERYAQVKALQDQFRNPYPCVVCGKRFKNKPAVRMHKQEEHAY